MIFSQQLILDSYDTAKVLWVVCVGYSCQMLLNVELRLLSDARRRGSLAKNNRGRSLDQCTVMTRLVGDESNIF